MVSRTGSGRTTIAADAFVPARCDGLKQAALRAICLVLAFAWCGVCNISQAQESLQVLNHSVRPAVQSGRAELVGRLPPEQTLQLTLVLPLRNQAALTALLGRLYDPSSPDYRHFLSVAEFTEQFGPTSSDYQAVADFAQANGFTVTGTPANRLIVPISGSVEQINAAFHVSMNVYRHPTEDRTFFSPDREPSLNLSVAVKHIAGLNNFSIPHPTVIKATDGQALPLVTGSGPGGNYLASDMRAAYYGGTTLTGTGQVVGLLEFGGYNLSEVNSTFSTAGQSYNVPVNNELIDGAIAGPGSNSDAEQVLDIVQAIGMAPGLSQVLVYIGNDAEGVDDANVLNAMATDNIAKQISVSWGWVPDDPSTDDVFFQEFEAQGQTVFVASGDEGAYDAAIIPYFYPAEDEYVTAVGGTHLNTNGAGGSWASETAWNSYGAGSGGGISPDDIPIASWQSGVANSSNGGSATLRNVPDVAMEGDFDNYLCANNYCDGGWAGTSFAAPRWAGFMALVNQQAVEAGTASTGGVGFINPNLYSIGEGSSYNSDMNDIVSGNNDTENQPLWYSAVAGYDLVTGWGSPAGQPLIDALAGPEKPGFWLAASTGCASLDLGSSCKATISVTDAGGFTGSVNLAITSALPSGVTATWGTNPTTGTSVLTLTTTKSAATGPASVTIVGTSGDLTVTTNLAVTVHAPDFLLSASTSSITIKPGTSFTSTITMTPQYGFAGSVNLAVTSTLPSGVSASWGTNPTTGTSALTLTASSSAPFGTANVTITGTSGALTATSTIALTVAAPGFTLSNSGGVSIGQGSSGTTNISVSNEFGFTGSVTIAVTSGLPSGVTASWSANPTTSESTLTLVATSTASPGQYTLTITGTSGSITQTTTVKLGVYVPTFTLSNGGKIAIGLGTSSSSTVYVTPLYGFIGSVNLSVSGLPSGVTASWSPNPSASQSTLTLTASSAVTVGQYPLTITGTSSSITQTTTLTLGTYVPTFTLSNGGNIAIGQGTSGSPTVYVTPLYGFIGSVNLSVSGLPSGVTASFSPNPTTSESNLTLTASSAAAIGQFTLTITGTCGTQTATTTVSLGVVAPTFTLEAQSGLKIDQGSNSSSFVVLTPFYGFTGSVNLSVSGLPSGVTASFSPNPTTSSATLTLTATSTAATGQYTLTITGTSGTQTASTTITLGVYAPSFTLSDSGGVTVGQGTSSTSNVYINSLNGFTGSVSLSVSGLPSGVSASFSPNPASAITAGTLTLTAASTASLGQYTVTITGRSGSQTATTPLTITIYPPSFTLSDNGGVTIGQGASSTSSVSITPLYGFTGSVSLSVSGLPNGVTASFSPNPAPPSAVGSTLTLTATNSASLGQYIVTITGTSGSQTATTTLSIGVYAPSFTVSDYSSVTMGQGTSSTSSVSITPLYGFAGNVNLSVSGLPSGVTASFSPNPASALAGSSTLTLMATSTASLGQYIVTITGTSGSQIATTPLTIAIYPQSFTLYDNESVTLGQGTSSASFVSINPLYGFAGNVSFSVSGLPSGVTASFSPNPAPATTGYSALTLKASSTAALGQYTLTITGTSGSVSASTTLTLGVYVPSFTLSNYSSVNMGQSTTYTSYVYINSIYSFTGNVSLAVSGLPSGVTASFSPNPTAIPSSSGNSLLTLTASSTASLGQYTVTITGTSGSQSASTTLPLGVYPQGFSLSDYGSPSIYPGNSGSAYVYLAENYGFTGSVSLFISGLPSGVTASFSPNLTTFSSELTLVASTAAIPGQYNLTITGTSGTSTASTSLFLTVLSPVPATLLSPTPGTQLTSTSVTFAWSAGGGVTHYWFNLGTGPSGAAAKNIYSGSPTTATQVTVTGLPTNGETVYATLYSSIGGAWVPAVYTFNAYGPATLTAPSPSSKLTASTTFTWAPVPGITNYWLDLGTGDAGANAKNIYNSGSITATSATVTGIPQTGETLYATLYTYMAGAWQPIFYTFTAAGTPAPAALTTPAPGSKLTSSSVTFTWSPGEEVTDYWFNLGTGNSGAGAKNLYSGVETTLTSVTASGLPTNGETIYATLYSYIAGAWQPTVYTYTASGSPTPAALITPEPAATITNTTVTFSWSAAIPATYYWFNVGTGSSGSSAKNIYSGSSTTASSVTVSGLPRNGETIYATLYSYIDGAWQPIVYTYTAP